MNFIKKNFKKIIIGLIILSVLFFAYNWYRTSKNQTKETVINPKRENIKEQITLAGSIDASSKADLRFQTSGQLQWIGVKVGDRVKKFQAVATLNKDQLRKQLQSNFNSYRSALATFDDTQDLYKTQKENLTLTDDMKRILVRSQNTLDNSVITYELNDLTIKYATLITPIGGIITSIDRPDAGVNITALDSIFVIDPKSIFFKSRIDQEDVVKIKVGDKTTVELDSYPDKIFDTKITYIAFTPVAGESSTVYEVHFELPQENDNLQYRLGMDGDAVITLNEKDNVLTLPTDIIQEENNQKYVLVKNENNQSIKKIIKTGIETDTITEILEGLSENDQVIIKQK